MRKLLLFSIILLVPIIHGVQAQEPPETDGTCPAIMDQVLMEVGELCSATGRNQACYGNLAIEVVAREQIEFDNIGDMTNVSAIESMRMSPLEEMSEAWGISLMRLQANLPNTLPGQNVTFLLYGDVELDNAVSADNTSASPMQAFYLQTGIGQAQCSEAPESGLMVQTPEGVGEVTFSVNGVDVSIGSTILFQAQANGMMTISAVEGAAVVEYAGESYQIVAGTQRQIALNADLLPISVPSALQSYDINRLQNIPLQLLERQIVIENPLSAEQLRIAYDLINQGVALCGVYDFLPTCDHIPLRFGGEACQLADDGGFVCDLLRDFVWGDAGFGNMRHEQHWANFSFDYNAIGIQNILNDYGVGSLAELQALLPVGALDTINLENVSLEQLTNLLDGVNLRLGVDGSNEDTLALRTLPNTAQSAVQETTTTVTDTAQSAVQETTTTVTNTVETVQDTTTTATDTVETVVQETTTTVTDTVETITEPVGDTVEEVVDDVGDTVDNVLGGLGLGG